MAGIFGPSPLQSEWLTLMPVLQDKMEHGNLVANDQWSPDEAGQSSDWHELRAVSKPKWISREQNKLVDIIAESLTVMMGC